MTELRDPYLRRPIPAATRPRRVALARPISRAGVRPRPQGRERLERPGPGTPTWVPACSYPESQSRRERREEKRQEENKSCKQAGRREATDGRTSGQASDDYRLRTIPIGRAPPPISHAAFQFQTLSSSRAAAGQQPTSHPGICWFIFPSLPAFRVSESLVSSSQTVCHCSVDPRPSSSSLMIPSLVCAPPVVILAAGANPWADQHPPWIPFISTRRESRLEKSSWPSPFPVLSKPQAPSSTRQVTSNPSSSRLAAAAAAAAAR